MSSTESRLSAVERQLRFHRAVIAALLVALVALVGYGATEGVPDVIRARKFVVVNDDGKEVAVMSTDSGLGMLGGGGQLSVSNKDGREVLIIQSVPLFGGATLQFYDDEGEQNLVIHSSLVPSIFLTSGISKDDPASIHKVSLSSLNGLTIESNSTYKPYPNDESKKDVTAHRQRVELGISGLTLSNNDGKDLFAVGATGEGDGVLEVYNKEGKKFIYAGADIRGNGLLVVGNKEGKDLIYAGANKRGDGLLQIRNKEGKKFIVAAAGPNGGIINIYNKTGEEVVEVRADDYGMGYIGAFDRQGKGRTLTPR